MNLYAARKGVVVALDVETGREVWRRELPKCDYRTQVLEHGGRVFASSWGYVYALDARSGRILWHNDLKGLGYGDVMMSVGGKHTLLPPPETHAGGHAHVDGGV